jgi:hypothetical protein
MPFFATTMGISMRLLALDFISFCECSVHFFVSPKVAKIQLRRNKFNRHTEKKNNGEGMQLV